MQLTFIMIVLTSFECVAAYKVVIKGNAAEILIEDQQIAKNIFRSLNGKIEEFSEVDGLYRHGKYWYCMVDGEQHFSCALYLKGNGLGELSSWEDDPDFGKSGLIEALNSQAIVDTVSFHTNGHGISLLFSGPLARELRRKLFFYPEKGIHYSCREADGRQKCEMKIPWDQKIKNPIAPVIQDSKA